MTNTPNIFDPYLQMRESNSKRELADMAMLRQMGERISQLESENAELKEKNEQLVATIAAMKAVQPVTKNYNIGRDYIAAQYLS